MKMNKQTRTFARQVQVDLLGLANGDLFRTIHLWTCGGLVREVSEEALSALGYTLEGDETRVQWVAPAPQQLRERLAEMDVKLFMQYVLPLAFQSLHVIHPEWDEGATFNAHLANHLRGLSIQQRR